MLAHLGYQAWIETDTHLRLPIYRQVIDHERRRVTCWIPGNPGQPFSICWHDCGSGIATTTFVILNGKVLAPGRFLYGIGCASRRGIRTSETTERPFTFEQAPDLFIEEPAPGNGYSDEGTVVLKIQQVVLGGPRPNNPIFLGNGQAAGDVSFGSPEVPAHPPHPYTHQVFSYENPTSTKLNTFVTFVFRYQTPSFLIAHGITTADEMAGLAAGENPVKKAGKRKAESSPAISAETSAGALVASGMPAKRRKRATAAPDTAVEAAPATWSMGPPPSHAGPSSQQGQFFLSAPVPAYGTMPSHLPTLASIIGGTGSNENTASTSMSSATNTQDGFYQYPSALSTPASLNTGNSGSSGNSPHSSMFSFMFPMANTSHLPAITSLSSGSTPASTSFSFLPSRNTPDDSSHWQGPSFYQDESEF